MRQVYGPYEHKGKWRIITVGDEGAKARSQFDTKEEALRAAKGLRALIPAEGITVGIALDQYEIYLRTKGNKPRTIQTTIGRVGKLLDEVQDRPIRTLTETTAAALYEALQSKVAVDTHRNALNETRTFMNWCAARPRQWIKANPFGEVEGEGKRKKGKPQLYTDESRKFVALALERARAGHLDGVLGLSALYFGTRITELLSRTVRDLDDDGRLLWISDSKTEAGKRTLEVPEDLQPFLAKLAEGKEPSDLLFPGVSRYMARDQIKALCRRAGVPEVGPHGLRGTHTSLARERGLSPHLVASSVGHTSYTGITQRHYLRPGLEERVQQKNMLEVLKTDPKRGKNPADHFSPETSGPAKV